LKLRVIDFISQHDESSHQQSPVDLYLRIGMVATNEHPFVNSRQLLILADRYLARFNQQESQLPRPLFADRANPSQLSGAVFDRIETYGLAIVPGIPAYAPNTDPSVCQSHIGVDKLEGRIAWLSKDADALYFPAFLRLSSLHNNWQFLSSVLPPSCQGFIWSASIPANSKWFLHFTQMPF
jgi:hypothetical protein